MAKKPVYKVIDPDPLRGEPEPVGPAALWEQFFVEKKAPVIVVCEYPDKKGVYHENRPGSDPNSLLPEDYLRTWTKAELEKVSHEIIELPPPDYEALAKHIREKAGLPTREPTLFEKLFLKKPKGK